MKKRRLGAPQIAFQILNTLIVVLILSLYGTRFIKYYKYFEDKAHPDVGQQLKDVLINTYDITATKGLIKNNDDSYTYVGDIDNNYVYYSGNYYRIIGINAEGNITIVSENTLLHCLLNESGNFIDSSVYSLLYDNYFLQLDNATTYLNYCINYVEKITDLNKISNNIVEQDMFIRPLTLQEYQAAGGKKSYLNTKESFWLENYDGEGFHYYIDEEGNLSLSKNLTLCLPTKVVFSLSGGSVYLSGNGSKQNPYLVTEKTAVETLEQCYVNQYVKIGDNKYIVNGKSEDGNVLLTLAEPIKINDEYVKKAYGLRNSYLSSDVYAYLTNTFLPTISDYKNKLVETQFTYSMVDAANEINYSNCVFKTNKIYVGLVDIANLFICNEDVLTLTTIKDNDRSIIVLRSDSYFEDLSKAEYNIQIVICARKDLMIGSGAGSSDDPFMVN